MAQDAASRGSTGLILDQGSTGPTWDRGETGQKGRTEGRKEEKENDKGEKEIEGERPRKRDSTIPAS